MKKSNAILQIVLIIALILTLLGCEKVKEEPPIEEKKYTIGFSMATFKEDRWLQDRDIFIAEAKKYDFDVLISNANNDADLQNEQISDMIKKGIDILLIVPHDSIQAARAVILAKREGIPVISYDRLVMGADIDAYVSFDNVRVGEIMGEALIEAVPTGNYIILNGSEADNNSLMFREGYFSVLQESIENGNINLIKEVWVQDWSREIAYEAVANTLKEKENINAIIAANDSLAWGAIDAISIAKQSKKIKIVGHDADLAACQRIVEGTQLLTVYKPITTLVEKSLDLCQQVIDNQRIMADTYIYNGFKEVPFIMIDVIPVTKENMEETVIKDGFHLKEDVYRTY